MISVNGKPVDEGRLLAEMQYHPGESQRESMVNAGESLIIAELLRQRAENLGIDVDDGEEFVQVLMDREVDAPLASDADCQRFYTQNPERFVSSPQVSVRHILIAADPADDVATLEAEDLARRLLKELQEDEGRFGVLAAEYSDCPSKSEQGSLGRLSRGQTVPEFERQVFRCQPGLLAQPVRSRYGFHLVFVDERKDGKALAYELVAERIAAYLNEKVRRKSIAQYIDTLIADADIEGFDFDVSASPLMQ